MLILFWKGICKYKRGGGGGRRRGRRRKRRRREGLKTEAGSSSPSSTLLLLLSTSPAPPPSDVPPGQRSLLQRRCDSTRYHSVSVLSVSPRRYSPWGDEGDFYDGVLVHHRVETLQYITCSSVQFFPSHCSAPLLSSSLSVVSCQASRLHPSSEVTKFSLSLGSLFIKGPRKLAGTSVFQACRWI